MSVCRIRNVLCCSYRRNLAGPSPQKCTTVFLLQLNHAEIKLEIHEVAFLSESWSNSVWVTQTNYSLCSLGYRFQNNGKTKRVFHVNANHLTTWFEKIKAPETLSQLNLARTKCCEPKIYAPIFLTCLRSYSCQLSNQKWEYSIYKISCITKVSKMNEKEKLTFGFYSWLIIIKWGYIIKYFLQLYGLIISSLRSLLTFAFFCDITHVKFTSLWSQWWLDSPHSKTLLVILNNYYVVDVGNIWAGFSTSLVGNSAWRFLACIICVLSFHFVNRSQFWVHCILFGCPEKSNLHCRIFHGLNKKRKLA